MTRDNPVRPGEPEFGRRAPGDTAAFVGPRAIGVALDVVESGVLNVERRDGEPSPAADKPTPARVPEWVKNPAKWQTMTRAERRAVERHHRRQRGR